MPREFDENFPIYLQIIRQFEVAVARGEQKPETKLPSVRETAIQMRVNPNTVQRAYQEMERSGLVIAKRGQGSFVTDDPAVLAGLRERLARESVERFVSDMAALGFRFEELPAVLGRYHHQADSDQPK